MTDDQATLGFLASIFFLQTRHTDSNLAPNILDRRINGYKHIQQTYTDPNNYQLVLRTTQKLTGIHRDRGILYRGRSR